MTKRNAPFPLSGVSFLQNRCLPLWWPSYQDIYLSFLLSLSLSLSLSISKPIRSIVRDAEERSGEEKQTVRMERKRQMNTQAGMQSISCSSFVGRTWKTEMSSFLLSHRSMCVNLQATATTTTCRPQCHTHTHRHTQGKVVRHPNPFPLSLLFSSPVLSLFSPHQPLLASNRMLTFPDRMNEVIDQISLPLFDPLFPQISYHFQSFLPLLLRCVFLSAAPLFLSSSSHHDCHIFWPKFLHFVNCVVNASLSLSSHA